MSEFYPERYKRCVEKAIEILRRNRPKDELEAYRILLQHEDELDLPVIWDIVEEAYSRISLSKENVSESSRESK